MSTASATRTERRVAVPFANLPLYELRRVPQRPDGYALEVWQLPSPASPHLTNAERIATLKGRGLRLMEARLMKRLERAGVRLSTASGEARNWPIDEEIALALGLLFRTLAPMRNLDRIRQVADGIDAMSREEAGYWLGMALHRSQPRRVLASLRMLLDSD